MLRNTYLFVWSAYTVRTNPYRVTGKTWYLHVLYWSFRIWSRRYAA